MMVRVTRHSNVQQVFLTGIVFDGGTSSTKTKDESIPTICVNKSNDVGRVVFWREKKRKR